MAPTEAVDGNDEGEEQAEEASAPKNGRKGPEKEPDDSEEDEDEDDEEPRLKYASLTRNLKHVYRNGDATSSFLVAGDKMVRRPPASFLALY